LVQPLHWRGCISQEYASLQVNSLEIQTKLSSSGVDGREIAWISQAIVGKWCLKISSYAQIWLWTTSATLQRERDGNSILLYVCSWIYWVRILTLLGCGGDNKYWILVWNMGRIG
jgi:hypothetical protein